MGVKPVCTGPVRHSFNLHSGNTVTEVVGESNKIVAVQSKCQNHTAKYRPNFDGQNMVIVPGHQIGRPFPWNFQESVVLISHTGWFSVSSPKYKSDEEITFWY